VRATFISYRRNDTEGEVGHLFADLVNYFGKDSVFMDVAAIAIGRDFRKAIDESVATCSVLLVVIGRGWIDATNENGHRRLDDPNDFVRLETSAALRRDIPVIPVLVQGAKMPRAEQLPDDLKELAYRNAVELTHTRWISDFQVLLHGLRTYVEGPSKAMDSSIHRPGSDSPDRVSGRDSSRNNTLPPSSRWKSRRAILSFLAVLVAAVVAIYKFWPMQTSTVPNVTGSTITDATSRLEAAHLRVGKKIYQQNVQKEPDTVLSQSLSPNSRVKRGTALDLLLAQRPAIVEVPPLVGKLLRTAEQELRGRLLKLGTVSRQTRSDVAKNTVLNEFPKSGEKVTAGTPVDLEVAEAPGVPAQVDNKATSTSIFATIDQASCSALGPGRFRINMSGRAHVDEQPYFLYVTPEQLGIRWRPDCGSWNPGKPNDGRLWDVSCLHKPTDPPETRWQTERIVTVPDGRQPPTHGNAILFKPGKSAAANGSVELTCQ
jgi:hypothetical protein